MNKIEKQVQQRVDLLEDHYQEWSETLIVETEMQRSLESQQRQNILHFVHSNLSPPVINGWVILMEQQSAERDEFTESKRIKRQHIRDRHKQEKLELTTPDRM